MVLGITAIVVQLFAWLEVLDIAFLFGIRILQPKVVAFAPAVTVTKHYGKSEKSPNRHAETFPKLYVAHTGYHVDNDPKKLFSEFMPQSTFSSGK
jgi:hypothetical protein